MRKTLILFCITIYLGSSPIPSFSDSPIIKWQSPIGSICASPAIGDDGTIYIGNRSNYFYAINPDGTVKWDYYAGSIMDSSPTIGLDGTIYFGGRTDFRFIALNPDGTEKWVKEGIGGNSSPAIGADGTIYFSSSSVSYPQTDGGIFYAFNPDGTEKWSSSAAGGDSSPAVGSDGTVYLTSSSRLFAFDPDLGTVIWSFYDVFFMGRVSSPIIASDGTIYFAVSNTLFAVNPDGSEKWKFETPSMVGISEVSIGSDGTLYFGLESPYGPFGFYAVNPDGSLRWSYDVGSGVRCAPSIGKDGRIYFSTYDGHLVALNSNSTEYAKLNITQGSYFNYSSPAMGEDGTIYLGADSPANTLYAISTESGGLADSPWPKFQQNNKNSGKAEALSQNTPVGVNVIVQPLDEASQTNPTTLAFDNVFKAGETSLTINNQGSDTPSGFTIGTPPLYYEISTTAEYTGSIEVCIDYSNVSYGNENKLKLFYYVNGEWTDITSSLFPEVNKICGQVDSLSPFAIFEESNRAPEALCKDVTIFAGNECTADASIDDGSFDPDGDPIILTQDPPGPYLLGNTLVTLTVEDGTGSLSECTAIVSVKDNTLPEIINITANPNVLWPANHKMAKVTVSVMATDNCSSNLEFQIIGVTCTDKGFDQDDWEIIEPLKIDLRAERSGSGTGRIYTIEVECSDVSGNTSVGYVDVKVPHDKGKK